MQNPRSICSQSIPAPLHPKKQTSRYCENNMAFMMRAASNNGSTATGVVVGTVVGYGVIMRADNDDAIRVCFAHHGPDHISTATAVIYGFDLEPVRL